MLSHGFCRAHINGISGIQAHRYFTVISRQVAIRARTPKIFRCCSLTSLQFSAVYFWCMLNDVLVCPWLQTLVQCMSYSPGTKGKRSIAANACCALCDYGDLGFGPCMVHVCWPTFIILDLALARPSFEVGMLKLCL
jgi:hypothetical protein